MRSERLTMENFTRLAKPGWCHEVTTADREAFVRNRLAEVASPASADADLRVLRAVFNVMEEWKHRPEGSNPFAGRGTGGGVCGCWSTSSPTPAVGSTRRSTWRRKLAASADASACAVPEFLPVRLVSASAPTVEIVIEQGRGFPRSAGRRRLLFNEQRNSPDAYCRPSVRLHDHPRCRIALET